MTSAGRYVNCVRSICLEGMDVIEIGRKLAIGDDELVFKSSRSSGPGGQNVNKVNTRITLLFDVANSPSLTEPQRRRILAKLATRIDKNGVLRVVSQKYRTQKANRNAAVEKFMTLLAEALARKPVRKKTSVPYSARQKRLQDKRHRSLLKQQRARRYGSGDD